MISNQYRPLFQRAQQMQKHMQTMTGTHTSQSYALNREMNGLLSDMSMNRHPQTIDGRIKTIERQMNQIQHQGTGLNAAYNARSAMTMHQSFQQLRNGVHNFYNMPRSNFR
jgi:uncharacterized membrane protein